MKKYFLLFALCIPHHSSSMDSQRLHSVDLKLLPKKRNITSTPVSVHTEEDDDEFELAGNSLPEHRYSQPQIRISSPSTSIRKEISIEEYIQASFVTPEMQCTYLQFFKYAMYEFNPQTLYSDDIPSLLYFFQELRKRYNITTVTSIDNVLLKYVVTHQDYDEPNNEASDIIPTATEIKKFNKKSYITTIKKNLSGTT